MNFHFVTVVWGDSYTDLFLKVVLPSQLSPGNLLSFHNKEGSAYKIYTTSKDAERIRRSPVFVKLSEILPAEIVFIDDICEIGVSNRFKAVSECHRRAINAAVNETVAFVCLPPDAIWSDGTFANLQKIALMGKKGVMVNGSVRVTKETFVPAFLKRFRLENGFTASVSSRELVKLALDHLHPYAQTFFWDSPRFHPRASWLNWSVNDAGILAMAFHLHPLMTCPRKQIASLSKEIDGSNYISFAHPDINDLYIVEDSDEIAVIEISDRMRFDELPHNKASAFKAAYWAKYNANSHHRKFLTHKTRIHYNDISPCWKEAEDYADKIMNSICFFLKFEAIFHFVRLLELFSPKCITSTKKKILRCITSPPTLAIYIAKMFMLVKMYRHAVFCLNKYLDYSGEKHFDYENVYNLVSRLQEESCYEGQHLLAEDILGKLRKKGTGYFSQDRCKFLLKK